MPRTLVLAIALSVAWAAIPSRAQQPSTPGSASLVSSWTLTAVERNVASGSPQRIQNSRGLLIFDSAGHVYEFFTTANRQAPETPQVDPLKTFAAYGGFWGGYRTDPALKRITFKAEGAISPRVMGSEFTRTLELSGDRLVMTSVDEAHAQGGTRWTWERVPTVDNLSPLYRDVVGFWQHVVEKRVNLTTNTTISESKRSPSVIVYTPGGFVGVHFPPLNRKPIAGDVPTEEEARAAVSGYVGYFGALTVYPGQVFHNVLAGLSPAPGTVLKRFAEISDSEILVRFPPATNQKGQRTTTLVTLRRLSGVNEMLPPK